MLKNYSNPVFPNKEYNGFLKKYIDLQNIGEALYRYKVLKENNFTTKANEEKSNIEKTILNGGISHNKYIWRAENSASTCDLCKALDGKVFDSYDEVPTRPHPNCQCRVEVLEDNYDKLKDLPQRTKKKSCDCITSLPSEFKLLVDNIQNLQNHIKNMVYNILTYLKTNSSVIYKEACENIINQAMYWDNAAGDFARNYLDMLNANTINADKYFHAKANCEATQRGGAGEILAVAISQSREIEEGLRKVILEGNNIIEQIQDAKRDLEANKYGREQGKLHPNINCKILIDSLRPNGLSEKY
ncbi:hypothetical protein IJE86_11345 [bacterium]|nr:hypothetical protein [bacterium]